MKIQATHSEFEDRNQALRWARSFRPTSVELERAEMQMRLERLPPEWESLLSSFNVAHVELGHEPGQSRLFAVGTEETLAELQQADQEGRPFILDQFAPLRRPKLTARQRYLLHSALDWGYYDVPRRITLEKMANRLGVGLNTLSVVLRNAEASLVKNFVLFDEKPGESAKRRSSVATDSDE